MAVALKVTEGRLLVELADAQGEAADYEVETLACYGFALWAVALTRDAGNRRVVRLDRDGRWWCDCPDYRWRRSKLNETCKHIACAVELRQVMGALAAAMFPAAAAVLSPASHPAAVTTGGHHDDCLDAT